MGVVFRHKTAFFYYFNNGLLRKIFRNGRLSSVIWEDGKGNILHGGWVTVVFLEGFG